MIKVTFPDGKVKEYAQGVSAYDIAKDLSPSLAREVISVSYNGKTIETATKLVEDGTISFHKWDDEAGKKAFWHSTSHVMAQALQELYQGIKITIGPAIERGFYYDIDFDGHEPLSEKGFPKIEQRMLEIAKEGHDFRMREVTYQEALDFYKENEYKTELIQGLEGQAITFCDHANFTDLCRGGHIPNTSLIKAVKLTSIAGAYWRGDEKNKQLTRVYGISFPKKKYLDEYLDFLEEAKKRDHRRVGKELELFTFSQKVGPGLPLWLPRGVKLREALENFLKKAQLEAGYEPVISPHIAHKDLYVTSGHYEKYGEDSFKPILTPDSKEEFLLKPMNCPHHCEIYKSKSWSYKDLPQRFAEFGTVYRYEQSGELHGLTRVRGFTQDDAHIFCMEDQILEEFKNVIDLVLFLFKTLSFEDFEAQVSIRDPHDKSKYIGDDVSWEKAEQAIISAAKEKGLPYHIEEGEAAFYGPKLDFMVKDTLGRKWQLGTIQVDYNLPQRFELSYKGPDNENHRPVMIHRAPFGSMERFIAILLEHTAGHLPTWLAPVQVVLIPVGEKNKKYAQKVLDILKKYDIRLSMDDRNETVGKKVRDFNLSKTPYSVVLGDKEEANETVSITDRDGKTQTLTVDDFAKMVLDQIP